MKDKEFGLRGWPPRAILQYWCWPLPGLTTCQWPRFYTTRWHSYPYISVLEEVSSHTIVIWKVLEFLELTLPSGEIKSNIPQENMQPAMVDPLLPFNEALLDPIMAAWEKPFQVQQTKGRLPAVTEPCKWPHYVFLPPITSDFSWPNVLSEAKSQCLFLQIPRKGIQETWWLGSQRFFSCSWAIHTANATFIWGRFINALRVLAKFTEKAVLVHDGWSSKQILNCGLGSVDVIARSIGSAVLLCQLAWVYSTEFSDMHATFNDMPFELEWLLTGKTWIIQEQKG